MALPLIALVLLLVPAAAHAATRWQQPVVVSPAEASESAVKMDSRGRALVVWTQGSELFYAWREPRSRFGRPRQLGGGGFVKSFPEPSVALAPNGVATAAYLGPDNRIAVRRAQPGKAFDPPRLLGDPAVTKYVPHVATDDEGRAVLTWEDRADQQQPRVMAAFVSARGALSEPVLLGDGDEPKVAMNPAGAAVIAWKGPRARPMAAIRPPEGAFMPAVGTPLPASSPLVAIDALGRAVVAATPFMPAPEPQAGTSFTVASQGGAFGPAQQLDTGGSVQQLLAEPDGSVDFTSYQPEGLKFASRRADGTVLGPVPISPPGACSAHLSVARGGDLLATWPSTCNQSARIVARLRALGPAFGPPVTIGEPGSRSPTGAVTDGDEAIIVYIHWATGRVHAVVREDRRDDPLPPPPDIDLDVPDELYLPDLPEIELPVRCARGCRVTPTGLLHAGDRTLTSARKGARRLKARTRRTLEVPFSGEARQAAEQAAGAGQPVWMSVSVVVRGSSPRPQTVTRRVELRAP